MQHPGWPPKRRGNLQYSTVLNIVFSCFLFDHSSSLGFPGLTFGANTAAGRERLGAAQHAPPLLRAERAIPQRMPQRGDT